MNVKGCVSWKKRAAYVFMFSINRLKSMIASFLIDKRYIEQRRIVTKFCDLIT